MSDQHNTSEVIAKYLTDNQPTVRATVSASGQTASFKCPFCRQIHSHGAGGGPGSRKSHCQQEPDPYGGSYWLEFEEPLA